MDSKADRKRKNTRLSHNLHFESVKMNKTITAKVCEAIDAFARFNGFTGIVVKRSNDKAFVKKLLGKL